MSDDTFVQQIDHVLEDPTFDNWNTTSLSFIIIGACMQKRAETRAKCIQVIRMYLQWRQKGTILWVYDWYDTNVPKSGMECMPLKSQLRALVSKLVEINQNYTFDKHEVYLAEIGKLNLKNNTPLWIGPLR